MEPQPITEGDYGYDQAHQEAAASPTATGRVDRERIGRSPVVGRPDLAEDFSYDQAHDF